MNNKYDIQEIVQRLNDLELAALLCFISNEHCMIQAPENSLQDVRRELELLTKRVFGLTYASLTCDSHTTLEDFSETVVMGDGIDSDDEDPDSGYRRNFLDNRKVAHVVIAVNLNQADRNVQIQALELMRSRRIYTRSAIHTAPRRFLLVSVLSSSIPGPPYLTPHLNDFFFIFHRHDSTDGFAYTEAGDHSDSQPIASRSTNNKQKQRVVSNPACLIPKNIIENLKEQINKVRTTAEMRRYIHNIATFLRLHRGVAGGVSAISTRHLNMLSRALAPLHGIAFVTPSLVALAARKVFSHRIEIATVDNERSLQWESDREAVAEVLQDMTPAIVVDEVLREVETPL